MGGTDDAENIQFLCPNCHQDKTYAESQLPEYRERTRRRHKGRVVTEATRKKLSELAQARWLNPEYRANQSETHIGRKFSDEPKCQPLICGDHGRSSARKVIRTTTDDQTGALCVSCALAHVMSCADKIRSDVTTSALMGASTPADNVQPRRRRRQMTSNQSWIMRLGYI
jgi:hypothetical protein